MSGAPISPNSLRSFRVRLVAIILVSFFAATSAQAAGLSTIQVPADTRGVKIDALIWTPCAKPPKEVQFLGMTVPGLSNCAVVGGKLPLIVISHGVGSNFLGHHDTAEILADNGFAVVALNHPLDSDQDMARARGVPALTVRPTDIHRLLDYVLRLSVMAANINSERIGFFGFSRGGYTGLVLGGAVPSFPDSTGRNSADPRIKAFVIVDPLSLFPTKDSLRNVMAPIQLWASETGDGEDVTPERVAALVDDLPDRPEFHLVPKSSHLSFIAPCSSGMAKSSGGPCSDPPGFDRAALHKEFNAQVLDFFRKSLPN